MIDRPPRKQVMVNWITTCRDPDAIVFLDDDLPGYVTVADRSASTGELFGHRSIAAGPLQAGIIESWRNSYDVVIDRRGEWVDVSPWPGRVVAAANPPGK